MTTLAASDVPAASMTALNVNCPALPPPSTAKLAKAVEELFKWDWEVKRDRLNGRFTAGGPSIDHLVGVPFTEEVGSSMNFARKLLACALTVKAENLSRAEVSMIMDTVKAAHDENRQYYVYRALKEHVRTLVLAIARHGAPGPDGQHRDGPEALMLLCGLQPIAPVHAPTPAASVLAEQTGTPVSEMLVPPASRSELLKAYKYVTSSGLCLNVRIASVSSLRLELAPGHGFKRRFDEIVSAGPDAKPHVRAWGTVLRTMSEVVGQASVEGLRAWLPAVDVELIFDPARAGEVLTAYEAELRRRTREVIESSGHLGLTVFPDAAYLGGEMSNL